MRRELVLDVLASGFLLVLVLVLVHGSPLSAQGGDTVPGRLGMVTMACDGASDLGRVEWLRWESMQGRKPYWARVSEDQGSLVSTFGPGSGYLGFWFFLDVEPGAVVYDQDLMRRALGASR